MKYHEICKFYGNSFCFDELYQWIDQHTKEPELYSQRMNQHACIILLGSPGIGKTFAIESICKHLDIHIRKIDSTNCKSTKDITDLITKMASVNLEDFLFTEYRKKIIFIDEFEIMVQLDRNMPSILYQSIDTNQTLKKSLPYIPVIIACNSNMEKKLGDIKRSCKAIYFKIPTDADVLLMLRNYVKERKLKIASDILLHITEQVHGNMFQALQFIEQRLLEFQNSEQLLSEQHVDQMPNIDILYNNPDRAIARNLFEEDIWMNPLRFHENLSSEFHNRKGTKIQKEKVYRDLLVCMLEWDTMMNSYDSECTHINISTEHLCNAPCSILSELPRKKLAEEASMNEFTKTLSQMSLQCKMRKQCYMDQFPWEHIGTYSYTLKKSKNKKFSTIDTDRTPYE